MSNDKPKRPFQIIFRFIRFVIAMVLTFIISFAVTLYVKSDDPAENFSSVVEELFDDAPIKRGNAPEIKTLFDEQNEQPFDPANYDDSDKTPEADKKISVNEPPVQPARQAEELGFLATIDRMTSIEPAVDEKVKTIPRYVPLDKIPILLCQAIISVEDTRFYTHKGFDLIGIARAIFVNVEAGEIQEGASTITQQTVKNLFLTSDQTFTRKAEELVLSMNMEKDFSKDKILEIYLNVIYFGSNFYGIYDAAQGYFGKEPTDLTIAECAMLAGLPNAPSLYSPYVDFHLAKQRQLVVIDAMERTGIISKTEAESARIEEIILAH